MNKKVRDMTMQKSLGLSVLIHLILLLLLVITVASQKYKPPVTVNLQMNAKAEQRVVKAGLIDKSSVDQIYQRHEREERLKAEKLLQEAAAQAAAKKALELANLKKIEMEQAAKKAAQQKLLQEKAAQEKAKLATQKAAALAKEQKLKKAAEKKQAADRKAAGLRAEKDRLNAEHDAFLENEVEKYKAVFSAYIVENRILSAVFTGNLVCTIRINLLPDGSILNVTVVKSSGNRAYDEMSQNAVHKSAPFPMPDEPELYNKLRDIVLSFRNGDQSADVL